MTLLTPLGLLGLVGIIILIIIYIIKPNYQQKVISSTYVWKLSLKYRKKKIPVNKLRNFLIILCQVLILTAAALILAEPVQVIKQKAEHREVIAIIDSSASMRTATGGETRFERAVNLVSELTDDVMGNSGTVSVILANENPSFLAERCNGGSRSVLLDELSLLVDDDACSYGVSNIESAIVLCEDILEDNPEAEVHLFTDTTYKYVPKKKNGEAVINVVNVSDEEEYNVAILDAYSVYEDNFYTFYVDVACYGQEKNVTVNVSIAGANNDGEFLGTEKDYSHSVLLSRDKTKRIVFINKDLYQDVESEQDDVEYYPLEYDERVFSYKEVFVYVVEDDSFQDDNNFLIYDGGKEIVKVMYKSPTPNQFFPAVIQNLRSIYKDKWDFWITEIKVGTEEPEQGYAGYDFYFFEHEMPKKLPTDGIVFLCDPDPERAPPPQHADFRVEGKYHWNGNSVYLQAEDDKHPLLNFINPSTISISMYNRITYGSSYTPLLLTPDGKPVLSVCDEPDAKIVVLGFSIHYSNLAINEGIAVLLYNVFEYFMPSTVSSNSFEINEQITLNARGRELYVSNEYDPESLMVFESFPASFTATTPGTYTLSQTTFAGKPIEEKIFVRIPASESNIWKTEDALGNPFKEIEAIDYFNDLMKFVALAMVIILFIEWWLHNRENG